MPICYWPVVITHLVLLPMKTCGFGNTGNELVRTSETEVLRARRYYKSSQDASKKCSRRGKTLSLGLGALPIAEFGLRIADCRSKERRAEGRRQRWDFGLRKEDRD